MNAMEDWNDPARDYRPVYIAGHPLHLTTLLIIVHCVTMVACALAVSARGLGVLLPLQLISQDVWRGAVWQLFTYAFVNMPSVWFAFEMLMLYWFGKDVERFVGRRAFVCLYAALVLIPAMGLALIGLRHPQMHSGSGAANFSVFIAFATIYPRAQIFFRIEARHAACILLAIYSLENLAYHLWISMFVLWCSAAIAHFGMRLLGVQGGFPWWSNWIEKRRRDRLTRQTHLRIVREHEVNQSLDDILEKISKQGMKSLTSAEKNQLEQARKALLQKDKRA